MQTVTQEPIWQPLDMLPLFVQMAEGMLDSSQEQLANMEATAGRLEQIVGGDTIGRMRQLYTEQIENVSPYLMQCEKWRQLSLTDEQNAQITMIEISMPQLEKISRKILSFIED